MTIRAWHKRLLPTFTSNEGGGIDTLRNDRALAPRLGYRERARPSPSRETVWIEARPADVPDDASVSRPAPMYAIRRIPGKGRGVVATQDVPAGAEIVTCPVIVYDWTDAGRIGKTRLGDYGFRFGDQAQRSCIVLGVISLCNHDDSPNAELVCREREEAMTLVAVRAIAPGEEICIKYRRPLWFTPAA